MYLLFIDNFKNKTITQLDVGFEYCDSFDPYPLLKGYLLKIWKISNDGGLS